MVISKDALWESGHDETVEVNQRALIDKVLARYSGEFTVFRELLQNSDDAQSKAVEIRFETQSFLDRSSRKAAMDDIVEVAETPLPDLKTAHVHHWTFKNNGMIFREEDWNRLKKIAEGNPDEEKIGAFGVGFYSLFSVTEEPMVTSGDQWMAFYWKDKKDQLFARRGPLPDSDVSTSREWTIFSMALREPTPIPVAFDFTRFLTSSITFMRHLGEISVYFDDKQLVKLTKSTGVPRDLGIPKGLNNWTPSRNMKIENIQSTPFSIQAQVMKCVYTSGTEKRRVLLPPKTAKQSSSGGFFSSLFGSLAGSSNPQRATTPALPSTPKVADPLAISETSVSLTVFSASIRVQLEKKLAIEIHRSTKKNPPTQMKLELIYTAKDQYDASLEEDKKHLEVTGSIFQGLRADLDGLGAARVFIGHSTAQTTGIGGHMAGRFIPTVERESIDFMDRNVAIWNRELLYVGGFLARSAYEFQLATVREQWNAFCSHDVQPSQEIQSRLTCQVLHALKFFMFYPSTPSSDVSSAMEAAFFSCAAKGHFSIMSTRGIRNSKDVRLPDSKFFGFLKTLPTLPDEIVAGAPSLISSLQRQGMITEITFQDVLQELRARPLPEREFIACLEWWIGVCREGDDYESLLPIRKQLQDAIILTIEAQSAEGSQVIPLASIRSFINPKSSCGGIPLDGPLPEYLLPIAVSKAFKPDDLSVAFPWTELTIVQWLAFICDPTVIAKHSTVFDINASPSWAERVLILVARTWPTLPAQFKDEIHAILRDKTCIPTSSGMQIPSQSYFPNVNMFRDLPVVTFPSGMIAKGSLEKVLQGLGVRKHVELQLIFNRMIKTNEWTIADLTKYLVSIKSTLTPEEIQRLKATAAFPKELSADPGVKGTRYFANQLFEPSTTFRSLGLPIIDWGHQIKWRSSSEEAKFLFELGLQRFPPLDMLINLCADKNVDIHTTALRYLIDNVESRYPDYDPMNFRSLRFIPALTGLDYCQGNIQEVFSNPDWAALGFLTLHPSLQAGASKLKIKDHPQTSQLVSLLATKPPSSELEANIWFRLLSTRVNDFSTTELHRLSTLSFVPVKADKDAVGPTMRWLPPTQCYLGSEAPDSFHSKLFIFVDFGSGANAFLIACGTKSQPSVEEVAKILVANPRQFYELAHGPTNFLSELRNIAVNIKVLSSATMTRMKRSPVLLGSQRVHRRSGEKDLDDLDDEEWDLIYDLKKPEEVTIADDTHAYQAFGTSLFTAPQEDILENFYVQLGSPRLSHLVREEYQTTAELQNSKTATETRSLILERLPLFLHEHTHTKTRVSFSWLSTENNFVVKTFGKLSVVKTLKYGELHLSKKQEATAVARRVGFGPIQLWIAGNSQIDMYEVAISLNRLLFDSPKANDVLLFMTILSTDLRALKRRGYNVDRILHQQKEARVAAESKMKENQNTVVHPLRSSGAGTNQLPEPESHSILSQDEPSRATDKLGRIPNASTSVANTLQNLRRKMGSVGFTPFEKLTASGQESTGLTPSPPQSPSNIEKSDKSSAVEHKPHILPIISKISSPARPSSANPAVTPLSHISNNIDMAIKACRSESSNLLRNREGMQEVKESLNEGYCDVSGRPDNLLSAGQMGDVKIYLSREVPNSRKENFMRIKQDPIARFIHVITPLANIYQLPLTSLHIFYDLEGGIIAFNRNGSIFLNLRYFEAWHDTDVERGELGAAYISWYYTLAHEIAHNLVQPHNSEHEFYFSAICEKYTMKFSQLLSTLT